MIQWKPKRRTRSSGEHNDKLILTPWIMEPAIQDDYTLFHLDRRLCLDFNNTEATRPGHRRVLDETVMVVVDDEGDVLCPFRPPFTRAQKHIISYTLRRLGGGGRVVLSHDGTRHNVRDHHVVDHEAMARMFRIVGLILMGDELVDPPASIKAACVWASAGAVRERDAIAVARMDLSLLPYMDYDTRKRLRRSGIHDIRQKRAVASAIVRHDWYPPGMQAYTIPWLESSEDDRVVILNGHVLDGIFSIDRTMVYMDIELMERIYMVGLFIVRPGGGKYVSFVSSDYDNPSSERELLDGVCREIERLENPQIVYYFAERRFWRAACELSGHSSYNLLNDAIDLHRVIGACGALFPGAPNMKLKTIGKALHERGLIGLGFPDGVMDGSDSMTIARSLYHDRLTPLDPDTTVMRIDGTHHPIPQLQLLLQYNHYDCAILHEIIGCLLKERFGVDVMDGREGLRHGFVVGGDAERDKGHDGWGDCVQQCWGEQ